MKSVYTILTLLFLSLQVVGQSEEVFVVEYDGESTFATRNIETRYQGEYVLDKGKAHQHFILKIDPNDGYMMNRSTSEQQWDNSSRKEIECAFICSKDGKPAVIKMQEFSDGEMKTYPAMIFLFKTAEEKTYQSKILSLRNGSLYLDEAQKMEAVAAQ